MQNESAAVVLAERRFTELLNRKRFSHSAAATGGNPRRFYLRVAANLFAAAFRHSITSSSAWRFPYHLYVILDASAGRSSPKNAIRAPRSF